ncbi:MAG: tyrosine-type recombinase/integrase [Candidatus Thiodiazotropha endolucinida]
MRQGEILSLTLDQVDLQRRVVRLNETKNGSARTVPLSKRAARVLRQAIAHPVRPKGIDLIFLVNRERIKSGGPIGSIRFGLPLSNEQLSVISVFTTFAMKRCPGWLKKG